MLKGGVYVKRRGVNQREGSERCMSMVGVINGSDGINGEL